MTTKAEREKEEAEAAAKEQEQLAKSSVGTVGNADGSMPKGMEHWGEGGTFRINDRGERVRVPVKE